jgi:CRISPR type III-B/RAMP module-associated protein Cmr5
MASPQQTLQQERAGAAWDNIREVERESEVQTEKKPEEFRKDYGRQATKLPAMIQVNGLGTAMAFLCAKAKKKSKSPPGLLYGHLSGWLMGRMPNSSADLMDWIRNASASQYRRATAEAIEYALWLRRYAEAQGWGDEENTNP